MPDTTKKRKREVLTIESASNKRANVENSTKDIKIKYSPKPANAPPHAIVVSAPGIIIPSKTVFSLSQSSKFRDSARNENSSRGYKSQAGSSNYCLSATSSSIEYHGQDNLSAEGKTQPNNYVGVYDPKTGELQILDAHDMVMRVSLQMEIDNRDEVKTPRQTNRALRTELGLEFGTKKAQKVIAASSQNTPARPASIAVGEDEENDDDNLPQQQSQRVLNDPLTAAIISSMEKTDAHMHLPTRQDLQAQSDASKPRPYANMDATSPAEVYPLETLMTEDEMQAMLVQDWIESVRAGKDVVLESKFAARRLHKAAGREDMRTLKILKYITVLKKFHVILHPLKDGGRKVPGKEQLRRKVDASEFALDSLRLRFTNGHGEMTKWHVDFFLTHICALTLLVDNFSTDTSDIREDFKLDTKHVHQYFRELGCRVKPPSESDRKKHRIKPAESSLHHVAKLELPLAFPKVRVMPIDRRR